MKAILLATLTSAGIFTVLTVPFTLAVGEPIDWFQLLMWFMGCFAGAVWHAVYASK